MLDPYIPPIPPSSPDIPSLNPNVIASIEVGIIALLGIALTVFRKRIFSEKVTTRREQFNFCPFCGTPINKTYNFA